MNCVTLKHVLETVQKVPCYCISRKKMQLEHLNCPCLNMKIDFGFKFTPMHHSNSAFGQVLPLQSLHIPNGGINKKWKEEIRLPSSLDSHLHHYYVL